MLFEIGNFEEHLMTISIFSATNVTHKVKPCDTQG